MKKIINTILVVIVLLVITYVYKFLHMDNRYFVEDQYQSYEPQSDYQKEYKLGDYVSETMDASAILRATIIGSMINYDKFIEDGVTRKEQIKIGLSSLKYRNEITKLTQNVQYEEESPIELEYVGEMDNHNYTYSGYLQSGEAVTGNIAIWGSADQMQAAISYQDGNGNVDYNKALLLSDDSNAEMLAYLIIETIQQALNTNYSPDEAATIYFNCTLEEMAGSISYHAIVSLISRDYPVGEIALSKVMTANISTIDEDGVFVNRSY